MNIDLNILISAIVSAMISGSLAYIATNNGVKKTLENNRKIEEVKMNEDRFRNRPKFQVKKSKFSKDPDHVIFVAPIFSYGKYQNQYFFDYDETLLKKENYIHFDYTFTNIGLGDSTAFYIAVNNKKAMSLLDYQNRKEYIDKGFGKFSYLSDKAIRNNESIKIRFYSHEDMTPAPFMSALLAVVCEDEYGFKWDQTFFYPYDNLYSSKKISYEEFKSLVTDVDMFDRMDDKYSNPYENLDFSEDSGSQILKKRLEKKIEARFGKYDKNEDKIVKLERWG